MKERRSRLNNFVKHLDENLSLKKTPMWECPKAGEPKSEWVAYSNVMTLLYNQQVHMFDPCNMANGDYISPNDSDTDSCEDPETPTPSFPAAPPSDDESAKKSKQLAGKKRKRREVKVDIGDIKTLQDLIDLIDQYLEDPTVRYDIDLKKLHRLQAHPRAE